MFKDSERKEFNLAYLRKKEEIEKAMLNKHYREFDTVSLNSRGSYLFDHTIVTLDIAMQADIQEIQVSRIAVVNDSAH